MKQKLNILVLILVYAQLCAGEVKVPSSYIPNSTSTAKEYKAKEWFRWDYIASCIKYIIEIDTIATFTSDAKATYTYNNPSQSSTIYIEKEIGNLYLGCFNYWHVQAVYKNDTSAWSKTHQFFTMNKAVATSPNGATNVAIPVTLSWEYQYGLTYTIIEIDTTSDFTSPRVINHETPNSTWAYHIVSTLKEGTTYYWRMKNCHSKDTTEWSDVLWFTTKTPTPTSLNENVNENANQTKKILINGQLYIIKDDKQYDATGFPNRINQ